MCAESPLWRMAIGFAGDGSATRSMSSASGSTVTDHDGVNSLAASRPYTVIFTGAVGIGKRSDSWKLRWVACASSVVRHSPKIVA